MIRVSVLNNLKNLNSFIEQSLIKIHTAESCKEITVIGFLIASIDEAQHFIQTAPGFICVGNRDVLL